MWGWEWGWEGGGYTVCLRVSPDDQAIKLSINLTVKHDLLCRRSTTGGAEKHLQRLIHGEASFPSGLLQLIRLPTAGLFHKR